MATISFDSNIPAVSFTYDFDEVTITTDLPAVKASVTDKAGRTLYESILYAYDGKVTIYDLARVFEEHMENHDETFDIFTLKVESKENQSVSASLTYHVLYSKTRYPGSAADWATRHFFNAAETKTSCLGSVEQLHCWFAAGSMAQERRTYVYVIDGEIMTTDWAEQTAVRVETAQMRTIEVDYNAIVEELQADRLLSVSVAQQDRFATIFYYDQEVLPFMFLSQFNTLDIATLICSVTRKATTEKSMATCNRKVKVYDREDMYSFELQTAPMTAEMAELAEKLCQARETWLYTGGNAPADRYKIVITDYTAEHSDSDEKLPSYKISFKFEDGRLVMTDNLSEIFTPQFLPQFN